MKRVILLGWILFFLVVALSVKVFAVPLSDFIPFGTAYGDSRLAENDDGSTPEITLSTSFYFFGNEKTSLWVNNNGNITFDGPMWTYTPFAFPGDREIVAPYFADVDTRGTGDVADDGWNDVYYGERTDAATLSLISNIINLTFSNSFDATYAFVATWDHVGYYDEHYSYDETNTFQVVLATDGANSYAIFNYLDDGMYWETGDASGGSGGFGGTEAVAGFDAGDNTNYYMIPGSREPGIAELLEDGSNIGVPGRWVFQISEEEIQPPSVVPEPGTIVLVGSGLLGIVVLGRRKKS